MGQFEMPIRIEPEKNVVTAAEEKKVRLRTQGHDGAIDIGKSPSGKAMLKPLF